jgi:IMP dehydrogenase
MDTVTESRLAIAIAQEGGIGIIHKNMTREDQAAQVPRVKKFESGVVRDPITVSPTTDPRGAGPHPRAGISGVPVVDKAQVVGIVTSRDLRFETRLDMPGLHHDDAARAAGHGRENAAKDEVLGAAAQAPHREGAGGQRRTSSCAA